MKVYLAGLQAARPERELRMIKAGVIKYRCISFANAVKIPNFPWFVPGVAPSLDVQVKHGVGIMMDSGVFSLRTFRKSLEKKGKDPDSAVSPEHFLHMYVKWCKQRYKDWDFYVTVDFVPDAPEIYKMQVRLEKMGLRPMPVFHGDSDVDYIRRYRDRGYTYMAIGAGSYINNRRHHLDAIFNVGAKIGMEFHGLALTAPWVMLSYPFASCDSSSWSRSAGYGSIQRFNSNTGKMTTLHISDREGFNNKASANNLNASSFRRLKMELEAEGFDYEELRTDFIARHIYNARTMLQVGEAADRRHGAGTGSWRQIV